MKAISVSQPWAWLIVNGHCDIDNRIWKTHYRGAVLIHASRHKPNALELDRAHHLARLQGVVIPHIDTLPSGGIVGLAVITGTCESSSSHWYMGPVGYQLTNARPLPFYPFRAQLRFFDTQLELSGQQVFKRRQPADVWQGARA